MILLNILLAKIYSRPFFVLPDRLIVNMVCNCHISLARNHKPVLAPPSFSPLWLTSAHFNPLKIAHCWGSVFDWVHHLTLCVSWAIKMRHRVILRHTERDRGTKRKGRGQETEGDGERQASKAKHKQSKPNESKAKTHRLIQSCHVIKHRNIEAKNNKPQRRQTIKEIQK